MSELEESKIEQKTIELLLGDVIRIDDPQNELLDKQTFVIDYIDNERTIWTNLKTGKRQTLGINKEERTIGTIAAIKIISRSDDPGYARQHGLVVGAWINIFFRMEGNLPLIITGEITNLEQDMIEIQTVDKETVYINFDYKGIPQDLPIEKIELREAIPLSNALTGVVEQVEAVVEEQKSGVELKDDEPLGPVIEYSNNLKELILKADQVQFGSEVYGELKQLVEVSGKFQRYSLDVQVTDLMDDLLSTQPVRTQQILKGIHQMIERYKQLRTQFSEIDDFGNVTRALKHGDNYKPLLRFFKEFGINLQWIMPVIQNKLKKYDNDKDPSSIVLEDELKEIMEFIKSTQFSKLASKIDPYFKPFFPEDERNKIMNTNINGFCEENHFINQRFVQGDEIAIKSFVTLPESVANYSRVSLNAADMLTRANLNLTSVNIWQLLKRKIITRFVDKNSLTNKYDVNKLNNHVWNDGEYNYDLFVERLVPTIDSVIKTHASSSFSLVDYINKLEPYLIYPDSLTLAHYNEAIKSVAVSLSKQNQRFIERRNKFFVFKRIRSVDRIMDQLFINQAIYFEGIDDVKQFSNSELLFRMKTVDGLALLNSSLSLANAKLVVQNEFGSLFQKDKQDDKQMDNSCDVITVAKTYKAVPDLEKDNGKPIYFDRRHDKTKYQLIDNYEKEIIAMTSEDFVVYLVGDLKKKLTLSDADASYLAATLISGYKQVRDGDYAMVYKGYAEKYSDQYEYYIRANNIWKPTKLPVNDAITPNSDILCNLQTKCVTNKDKCEPIDKNKNSLNEKYLNDVMTEFDDKYKMSTDEYTALVKRNYDYNVYKTEKLKRIQLNKRSDKTRSNEEVEGKAVLKSPFSPVLDFILQESDAQTKHDNIIKFVAGYTRKSLQTNGLDELEESPHWLYCIQTGAKLLPLFRYELATKRSVEEYNNHIEVLKQTIGEKSGDGDKWIDKFSGWTILNIDLDEGYDINRGIIEEDMGITLVKYTSPNSIAVSNIVNAISSNMGINLEKQKEFIVNGVTDSLLTIVSEDEYNQKVKEMEKKNKTMPPYKDYFNSSLLFYTFGLFIVAAQIVTPSIVTRRTYPGCVKSFVGYPLDLESSDFSSIEYLACVVHKMVTKVEPWNVLHRVKVTSIVEKIKKFVGELVKKPDVKAAIDAKLEYLVTNKEESDDRKTVREKKVAFKIKNLQNVATEFDKDLIRDLRQGNLRQREKILVLSGKMMSFSLAVQEQVRNVVESKGIIMRKMNGEPYLENACCESKEKESTIQYFIRENKTIGDYNQIVTDLNKLSEHIASLSKADVFSLESVGKVDLAKNLGQEFSEASIYSAFIHFCKLDTLAAVPANLKSLCREKPAIKAGESLSEMVRKMKNAGLNYGNADLLKLLQLTAKQTDSSAETIQVSPKVRFMNIVEKDLELKAKMSFEPNNKSLNNFLQDEIEEIKKELLSFVKTTDVSRKQLREITTALTELTVWKVESNSIPFLKTFITNFAVIIPNMILTAVDYNDVAANANWDLSPNHKTKVRTMIAEYYESLREFYGQDELYTFVKRVRDMSDPYDKMAKETQFLPLEERTVGYLYEYYLLKIAQIYIKSMKSANMRNTIGKLLITIFRILDKHKEIINVSYQDIEDRVFKLKEREKNMVTDRLKNMTDEQRQVDTVMKINKLGVWGKGMEKGLTTYTKEGYESELDYKEAMILKEKTFIAINEDGDENFDLEQVEEEDNDLSDFRGEDNDYDYEEN